MANKMSLSNLLYSSLFTFQEGFKTEKVSKSLAIQIQLK